MKKACRIEVVIAPDENTGAKLVKLNRCDVAIVQYSRIKDRLLADVYARPDLLEEISRVSQRQKHAPKPVAGVRRVRFSAEADKMRRRILWQFSA